MGLRGWFQRHERARQADKAADQLYVALCAGTQIRIPQSFSTDDPATQMILRVKEKYPDVMIVFQADSVLLSREKRARVSMSAPAWDTLDGHGYFPDRRLPAVPLLDAHGRFIRNHTTKKEDDVMAAANAALRAERSQQAIVLAGS